MPSDPVEAEKLELMKMRTLERRAKMSELQRLRNAQVGAPILITHPCFIDWQRLRLRSIKLKHVHKFTV